MSPDSSSFVMQALLNMGRTSFIILILVTAALLFMRDADRLVLKPLERMMKQARSWLGPTSAGGSVSSRWVFVAPEHALCFALRCSALAPCKHPQPLRPSPPAAQVKSVSENPLARSTLPPEELGGRSARKATRSQQLETRILENSISKICSLLSVGFGEVSTPPVPLSSPLSLSPCIFRCGLQPSSQLYKP